MMNKKTIPLNNLIYKISFYRYLTLDTIHQMKHCKHTEAQSNYCSIHYIIVLTSISLIIALVLSVSIAFIILNSRTNNVLVLSRHEYRKNSNPTSIISYHGKTNSQSENSQCEVAPFSPMRIVESVE